MNTLDESLTAARQSIAPAEARLLLTHVLGRSQAWLAAHGEDVLEPTLGLRYASLVARRAQGEPIAYLVGRKEFYGREFLVTPDVLIPRPETELLVELAVQRLKHLAAPSILDMGCGSGCLAVTLALELPQVQVTALDKSPAALAVAANNAARLGARVAWLESDWYAALGKARFDLIVSNPPYVASADPHLAQGDLRFEPLAALAAGASGLDDLRRIVAGAPRHLKPQGWLLCEHGYDQAPALADLLAQAGFGKLAQYKDLAGIVRVSGGEAV